jgi:glutathione peroxidase
MLWMLIPLLHAADLDAPLQLTTLEGTPLPDEQLSGRVLLVVNVASRCGFTHQYADLQALHEEFSADGLTIIGVPCDQFGSQEPGSAAEIRSFCETTYGVTFPVLEKQAVNGAQRSALYTDLITSEVGASRDVRWNFEKFLVDRDGTVIDRFPSQVSPSDLALRAAIQSVL